MNAESNTPKFKIIVGILSFLLIALSVYTVILFNDNKETVSGLEEQKSTIEGELEELIADYDIVIQDNEIKDQDLIEARTRIVVLLDSVKDAEANLALIRRYKREINKLKDERVLLFKKADSLIAANQMLAIERDSTYLALNETIKVVDSVTGENLALSNTIKEASVVKAVDLSGSAVIVRNNGRIVDTKRSSRADKVRTCFTLTPNIIAEKGDRLLYIQVYNPKKKLLGDKGSLIIDDQALNYSKSTKVFYENEELDVCVLVDANEGELIQGRYVINVFDGPNLVATSSMILK